MAKKVIDFKNGITNAIEDAVTEGFEQNRTAIRSFLDSVKYINTKDWAATIAQVNKSFSNDTYVEAIDEVMRSVAAGGHMNRLQGFMKGIDRYQRSLMQTNVEHSGLTFITRPRLNLQPTSILQDRRFEPMLTGAPSMGHAIRSYLDTKFGSSDAGTSPLVNKLSPWFTPLMNGLVGISGFPDPVLQTATTSSGFFSEDQTFAIGYDNLMKTYDLSLTFKDPQSGPITAIFYYWLLYMHNMTRGTQIPYPEDITYQRLCYTVSIYRFRLDPSRQYITGYCKATGCFPKSVPLGGMFNYGEGELFAPMVGKYSIPFVANRIEYNDYAILMDFNALAKRYWNDIDNPRRFLEVDLAAGTNLSGVPFISTSEERVEGVTPSGKSISTTDSDTNGASEDERLQGGFYRSGGRPRLTFRIPNNNNAQLPEV